MIYVALVLLLLSMAWRRWLGADGPRGFKLYAGWALGYYAWHLFLLGDYMLTLGPYPFAVTVLSAAMSGASIGIASLRHGSYQDMGRMPQKPGELWGWLLRPILGERRRGSPLWDFCGMTAHYGCSPLACLALYGAACAAGLIAWKPAALSVLALIPVPALFYWCAWEAEARRPSLFTSRLWNAATTVGELGVGLATVGAGAFVALVSAV